MIECKKLIIKDADKTLLDVAFSTNGSLAIVGQSGSGKSLLLKAVLGLSAKNLQCEIECVAPYPLIRGKTIGFIPQNPFTALSPMTKIKKQFFAPSDKARDCMELVGLGASLLDRFPSELSGGQLQRVIIAMALVLEPKILLLDEPTTALDFETKEHLIALIEKLKEQMKFDMLFVTHELPIASRLCDECAVLKEGRIVEFGKSRDIFTKPSTPYAKALLEVGFERRSFRI